MKDLETANTYLKNRKHEKEDYRPSFHLSPDYGWCNDAHGIVFFKGQYHIFFQYNPYDTKAENVFWGHMTSKDLIHFSSTSCAIAPDQYYDNSGCWSGSSIVIGDTLYLVYTGFSHHENDRYYQTINLAYSKDGIHFTKYEKNPIIDTMDIPSFGSIYDFRDPCVFARNGKCYILVGNKSKDEKEAMLLLYEGEDIFHFRFLKTLVSSSEFGTMFECPNLISFPDRDYIVMSPQNVKEKDGDFANVSSCVYFPLVGDFLHEEQRLEDVKEIDHGLEFYAPTVYNDEKLLVSWFQMWGRRYYLNEINNDFINCFSLFKKIEEKNGRLRFKPIAFHDYAVDKHKETFILNGKSEIYDSSHYIIGFDKKEDLVMTIIFSDGEDKARFIIDCKNQTYTLDRSQASIPLGGEEKGTSRNGIRYLKKKMPDKFEFDIYVDQSYIEIYFDDYEESFSFIHFADKNRLSLECNQTVSVQIMRENIEVR